VRLEYKNLNIISEKGKLPNLPFLKIKNEILGKDFDLTIIYTSKEKNLELNKKYRSKDYIPNILTFPYSDTEGEIYMSRGIAYTQYKDFDMPYQKYLTLLIVHGCLHLKGHTHDTKQDHENMLQLENEITDKYFKEKRK
jgi:probable rRNA maturation factor